AQARYGHRRGQLAVEQARLEPLFAPDDVELRITTQQVDRFAVAVDLEPLNREVALVGQPADSDRVLVHQALRIVDPHGSVVIGSYDAVLEPVLVICDQLHRGRLDVDRVEAGLRQPNRRCAVPHAIPRLGHARNQLCSYTLRASTDGV